MDLLKKMRVVTVGGAKRPVIPLFHTVLNKSVYLKKNLQILEVKHLWFEALRQGPPHFLMSQLLVWIALVYQTFARSL